MRLAMLVAVSALAFAPAAFAGTTGNGWTNGAASTLPDPNEHKRSTAVIPPIYKIDARGRCHGPHGHSAPASKCSTGKH